MVNNNSMERKDKWLHIFHKLSGSVGKANISLNNYLEEFLKSESSSRIIGKQNRIKSAVSFADKLIRSNCISNWTYIDNDDEANMKTLSKSLPDYIGFRITTLFFNEEEKFANALIDFLTKKQNVEIPETQKNPKNLQANGHSIIKFQGFITPENDTPLKFGFEIQIKSSIHNLWGEVEHSSIYKPSQFDFRINQKKESVENIWETLTSSDKQLFHLNKETYKKEDLLKQLFTTYLEEINFLEPLNSHYYYSIFFNVFIYRNINTLEDLVSQLIVKKNIESKLQYSISNLKQNYTYSSLKEILSGILYQKEMVTIKKIFDYCFNIEETEFLDTLIFSIIKNMGLDETDDPELFGSDIDEDEGEQNDLITEDNAEFLGMLSKLGFKTERFEKNVNK